MEERGGLEGRSGDNRGGGIIYGRGGREGKGSVGSGGRRRVSKFRGSLSSSADPSKIILLSLPRSLSSPCAGMSHREREDLFREGAAEGREMEKSSTGSTVLLRGAA